MRKWKSLKIKVMLKITVVMIALSLCAPAIGKTIYVDAGGSRANNGSSWADAYSYLQDALADANMAEKPVEILVAQGIYKPDQGATMNVGDRSATFQLINGVAIYGGYPGVSELGSDTRDIERYKTILSGDIENNDINVNSPEDLLRALDRADNSYQIVTGSGTDETAVIDGFTITSGNAYIFTNRNGAGLLIEYGSPQISNCTFINNSAQYFGGGIYNYYSSPIIVNCTFIQNSTPDKGGGIFNYQSSPVLTNCTFSNNSSRYGGGIHSSRSSPVLTDCTFIGNSARQGGGAYNDDSSGTLINCTFTQNSAEDEGGGLYSHGNNPNLTNCTFIENSAEYGGGGIYCSGNPMLTNCKFIENSAHYGGGIYNSGNPILTNCILIANSGFTYGGGMYNNGDSLTLNNCIVAANRAYSYGGGLSNNNCDLTAANCTFTGNSAPNGSTMAFNSSGQRGQSTVGLIDCILWDNGNVIWNNDRSTVDISYSNIRGGWPGEGNIDTDPLFVNPLGPDNIPGTEDDDFRLAPLSPCIDAGDPSYAPEPNKTDLDGNPRIISGRVDMGAYEFRKIYVDGGADGANDGSSWENAFTDLQGAIEVALEGDEIRMAQGIYTPTQDSLDREATFDLKDGVSIIGGYAGLAGVEPNLRDVKAFSTILSGDIDHNDDTIDPNSKDGNSRHVVTCIGRVNEAVLDGVTITGGYAWPGRGHDSVAARGGGLYCHYGSSPRLIDCIFTDNYAGAGGAVYLNDNYGPADEGEALEGRYRPVFLRCIFVGNNAGSGGAVANGRKWHPEFTNCLFEDNIVEYHGGAIASNIRSGLNLKHCVFRRNTAGLKGGAIYTDLGSEIRIANCLFVANTAGDSGGAISCPDSIDATGEGNTLNLLNCTFYGNSSPTFYKPPTNALKNSDGSWVHTSGSVVTNCIFYNSIANEVSEIPVSFEFGRSEPLIITSIYEKEPGQDGAISPTPDPLFVDPYGADGILGTEDDDFRLAPLSPGIDSGDPSYVPEPNETDLDGNPRLVSGRIDMGAYEFQGKIYVGGDVPENPMGYGTENDPMIKIQEAIDIAKNGYTVLVRPGVYEPINFEGKALTVAGDKGAAVIEAPWVSAQGESGLVRKDMDAVTFHTGEGPGSVLKNFIIKNSTMAISLNYGSRPTISNITIVNNDFGIAAYENSNPDISNCIFWNNTDGDLFQCQARYSCFEGQVEGQGNISGDPLFVDAANGDYHLKSQGWRWSTTSESWINDDVTSPCIDAGDPDSSLAHEPLSMPMDPDNLHGVNQRVNMGAFGGTSQSSMPPPDWVFP